MEMNKSLAIILCLFMLFLYQNATAKTCKKLGITTQCDDGTSYKKMGNRIVGSDGKSFQAVASKKTGAVFHSSDGKTYKMTDTLIRGDDGTICKKIGMNFKCTKKPSK